MPICPAIFPCRRGERYIFVDDIDPTWTDSYIWDHTVTNDFTIVSKDADFSDRV